jgi:hypothetical protein
MDATFISQEQDSNRNALIASCIYDLVHLLPQKGVSAIANIPAMHALLHPGYCQL